MQLSVNLVGVVSQTLVRRADGRGRAAAFEVLVATGAVRNLIRENKTYQISSLIQTGMRAKMQTLDQSLASLAERGIITVEEARMKAKDPWEFDRLMALHDEHREKNAPANNGQAPQSPQSGPPSGGVRGQPNRPAFKRE